MRDVAGMSVVVTGGGSGLGAGLAGYLASRGARVTISGRRADKLEAVSAPYEGAIRTLVGDVRDADHRKSLIETAVDHGGGLDVLVNNAGNILRGPITELVESELLDVFHTNIVAGMMLTGLAVEELAQRKGSIIFMGSVHTRRAFPGASPYAATKAACETVARVLAAELGSQQIRVNCVIPGAVPTELNIRAGILDEETQRERMVGMVKEHVIGRVGVPLDVAEACEYLIRADWVTGSTLVVDGGLSLGASTA